VTQEREEFCAIVFSETNTLQTYMAGSAPKVIEGKENNAVPSRGFIWRTRVELRVCLRLTS